MVRGMTDYAKQKGAKEMTVTVDKENAPFDKVLSKIGFKIKGKHL